MEDNRKSLSPEDEKRLKEREQRLLREMDETRRETDETARPSPSPRTGIQPAP